MSVYLGTNKVKIILDGKIYKINIDSSISDKIRLLSSDKYILKDSNGIYLVPKEGD